MRLPPVTRLDSHAARIARDKCRNSKGAADIAGVDQVVVVKEILGVSGDFPANCSLFTDH